MLKGSATVLALFDTSNPAPEAITVFADVAPKATPAAVIAPSLRTPAFTKS